MGFGALNVRGEGLCHVLHQEKPSSRSLCALVDAISDHFRNIFLHSVKKCDVKEMQFLSNSDAAGPAPGFRDSAKLA